MSTPDDSHFDPDDPRLTAYALDELPDPADRAHVEAVLAASPEAHAELADIRALTAALTAEYKQDRLTDDDAGEPTPANVIRLLDHSRAWVRPLLAVAAVLLLAGVLAGTMLPVFHSMQVKGSHRTDHPFASAAAGTQTVLPDEASPASATSARPKTDSFDGRIAQDTKQLPQPASPALPQLAANATPASPLLAPTGSANGYPGATSLAAGTLLADASKTSGAPPEIVEADRVMVTGSNLPTSEEVAAAPVAPPRIATKSVAPAAAPVTFRGQVVPANAKSGDHPQFGVISGIPVSSKPLALLDSRSRSKDQVDAAASPSALAAGAAGGSVPAFPAPVGDISRRIDGAFNTAAYDHVTETSFLAAKDNPLSAFSVDVDTASYSIVRRFIEQGSLPPAGAVRIEEMLNYFPYDYAPPAPGDERPFAIHLEGAACPWNPDHRLVRIALKGREMAQDKRPPSNLVFLIDVSGSMEPPERLPLIKESLRLLVERLTDNDRVAIVVYAGNSGLVLPSTNGAHKDTILQALDRLEAGGSTNGASGIKLAYKVAQENFLKGGTNRVILATDGDFNVGTTSQGELVRLIETEAKGGVFLTALGVGTDNLKDSTMQKLADHGNGNYAYLDRIEEGKKVLVEQMSGTLVTIAKDVKIQVEFNPAAVNSYRLIGYEKRLLRKEDFNDDRVDAGEIGAGHSVTALYEVVPAGQTDAGSAPAVDALKYQSFPSPQPAVDDSQRASAVPREMLTVKIRHKAPDSATSERSYEAAFVDHGIAADYANASPDFKFAAAVATFGLVLRDSPYKGNATLGAAVELAQESKGADASGYRAGFIELARRAQSLSSTR